MNNDFNINVFYVSGDTMSYDLLFLIGHLDYHQIKYKTFEINWKDPVMPEISDINCISILIASKYDDRFIILNRLRSYLKDFGKVIIVGWLASCKRDEFAHNLSENETLIYGDYHKTLSDLLKNLVVDNASDSWNTHGGKLIRGELWNPNEYLVSDYARYLNDKRGYVFYSTGCNRACAYCSYGANYKSVYKETDLIRKRNVIEVFKDIERFYRKDIKRIRLVAEQVIHEDFHKNYDFVELCEMLGDEGFNDICLEFNISTFDVVQNITILEQAAKKVNLALHLNIDFASQDMLKKFKLPSSVSTHKDALRFCSEKKIPFNVNYIFYHPWLNETEIQELIEFLKETSDYFLHNTIPFGYLVITQILLTSYHSSSYEPSDPLLKAEERIAMPTTRAVNFTNLLFKALIEYKDWFSSIIMSYEKEDVSRLLDVLERLLISSPSNERSECEETEAIRSVFKDVVT